MNVKVLQRQLNYYRCKDLDQKKIKNLECWIKSYQQKIAFLEKQLKNA